MGAVGLELRDSSRLKPPLLLIFNLLQLNRDLIIGHGFDGIQSVSHNVQVLGESIYNSIAAIWLSY